MVCRNLQCWHFILETRLKNALFSWSSRHLACVSYPVKWIFVLRSWICHVMLENPKQTTINIPSGVFSYDSRHVCRRSLIRKLELGKHFCVECSRRKVTQTEICKKSTRVDVLMITSTLLTFSAAVRQMCEWSLDSCGLFLSEVWVFIFTDSHSDKDAITPKLLKGCFIFPRGKCLNPMEYQTYEWRVLSPVNKQPLEEIMLIIAGYSWLNNLTKPYVS